MHYPRAAFKLLLQKCKICVLTVIIHNYVHEKYTVHLSGFTPPIALETFLYEIAVIIYDYDVDCV